MLAEEWDNVVRLMSERGHTPDFIDTGWGTTCVHCECGWETPVQFLCHEFQREAWLHHAAEKTDMYEYL